MVKKKSEWSKLFNICWNHVPFLYFIWVATFNKSWITLSILFFFHQSFRDWSLWKKTLIYLVGSIGTSFFASSKLVTQNGYSCSWLYGMYVDKHYQMHFQIVYPNTFRIVVKQLLHTEENGYRDVSYYSLNQFIKPIEDMKQLIIAKMQPKFWNWCLVVF